MFLADKAESRGGTHVLENEAEQQNTTRLHDNSVNEHFVGVAGGAPSGGIQIMNNSGGGQGAHEMVNFNHNSR